MRRKNTLGDYVLSIMQRHPDLSMRQASIDAGLNENAVQQIVNGNRPRPRHDTLKAIADKWGDEHDYYEMCRLAGYPTPVPPDLEDAQEVTMLMIFRALPSEEKQRVLQTLSAAHEHKESRILPIALRAGELDERGQRTILEMIDFVQKAQEEKQPETEEATDPS